MTKHFVSVDVWAGEWFMWHAENGQRMEYLRKSGFPFIVDFDTGLSREGFDQAVEPVTTGPWTKTIEVLGHGRFRVTAAFQHLPDALMARMVVDQ